MEVRETEEYKERDERQDIIRGGIKWGIKIREGTLLFIYLFNNTVRISKYIASNGRMISE
jgi:hypothetical protein